MEYVLRDDEEIAAVPLSTHGDRVREFYFGRTILITGGTGFIGKILLEKILRCCPEVKKIFLLVRLKNYLDTVQRAEELFELPLFDSLRQIDPNFLEKVEFIKGDLCLPNLGLTEDKCRMLMEEVEVVFHCASTTLFDVNLKICANVNVRALRDLVLLAKKMKNLKAFVHLSTIYVQCFKKVIEEAFARAFISGKALIEFASSMDPNVTFPKPINLGRHINNYIFTKSIAEDILKSYGTSLPVVIVRSGIAISTYKDPIPGWTDNMNGPSGLILSIYIGLAKTILAKKQNSSHLIPADFIVNAMITAAWDVAQNKSLNDNKEVPNGKEEIPIYNMAGSKTLTWGAYFDLSGKYGRLFPTKYLMWHTWHFVHTNLKLHGFLITFFHYIPACLLDFITYNLYSKTKYLAYYSKIGTLYHTLSYFMINSWKVKNDNTIRLWAKLSREERQIFYFDIESVNWEKYFQNYILGIRKGILKDEIESLEEALQIQRRLAFYTLGSIVIFLLILYFLIIKIIL